MTWDVLVGGSESSARVLVTVTDEVAAQRIATALDNARDHWFQAAGQRVFVRQTQRDGDALPEPEQVEQAEPEAPDPAPESKGKGKGKK